MKAISACIKDYYSVASVVVQRVVKESIHSISYEALLDGKRYFIKRIQKLKHKFLFQNDELYYLMEQQIRIPKIKKNRCGKLYSPLNDGSAIVLLEWLDIELQGERIPNYIKEVCKIVTGFSEIDISLCLSKEMIKLYQKKVTASFAPRIVNYEYLHSLFSEEVVVRIRELNRFYERNINSVETRIRENGVLGIIHGDLNSTNIVSVNGDNYLVDFDSIRIGFGFEDADIIALDLCVRGSVYSEFLKEACLLWKCSPLQVLCGQIKQLNGMLTEMEKQQAKEHDINATYFTNRILVLSEMISDF